MNKELLFFINKIGYIKLTQLLVVILIYTFFELITIGSIFPLIKVVISPDWIKSIHLPLITEKIQNLNNSELVSLFLAAFLILFITRTIVSVYTQWFNFNFNYKLQILWSHELLSKYLSQPYLFHASRNSSEFIRNLNEEVGRLIKITIYPFIFLLTELLILLSIASVIFYISYKPLLFFLVVFILFAYFYFLFINPKLKKWGHARTKHSTFKLKTLIQALSGIKDIILLQNFKFFINKFNNENIIISKANRNFSLVTVLPKIILEFTIVCLILIFIAYNLKIKTELNVILPTMGVFFAAAFRLMPSFNKIFNNIQLIRFGRSTSQNLYKEFNLENYMSSLEAANNNQNDFLFNEEILVDKLSYNYPGKESKKIFIDINLSIKKGECIGIMGESGSGKSTLIDMLLGLINPTKGNIYVDGKNLKDLNANWFKILGHIPQEIYLLDESIKNNVALGKKENEVDLKKVELALRDSQLSEFVERLPKKIDTEVGERGSNISGGEKQRIGIARALYKRSQVLIFDEATSALDEENEKKLLNVIESLKGKKTIILSSHNLRVFQICDKIYKIENNKLNQIIK